MGELISVKHTAIYYKPVSSCNTCREKKTMLIYVDIDKQLVDYYIQSSLSHAHNHYAPKMLN